ncbi:MAG: GGDEF domain-containing protein [Alcaligenaceae bacterium]|nr:GGDEF domain-containing protein [Alcaligenaceae bacterium]
MKKVCAYAISYSELKSLFDHWRAEGVRDIRSHLLADPERISQCSSRIRLLRVNARTLSLYGAQSFQDLANQLESVFRDDMHAAHIDELEQLWSGAGRFQSQTANYTLDGRRLDLLLKGVVLPDHKQSWDRVLVVIEDITEQESARRQLAASEEYSRRLFENAPVSLWVADYSAIHKLLAEVRQRGIVDFRTFTEVHPEFIDRCLDEILILDVNQYTLMLFRAPDKTTLQSRLREVFRKDMQYQIREHLIDLWEGTLQQQREMTGYALDGHTVFMHLQLWVVPGHEARWDQVMLAFTDITARKKAENYLEYLGQHDVLSGLKNRAFFTEEVERLRRKGNYPITAIVLDLNNLKQTNDESGHAAGDSLLRRCGEIISQAVEKPAHASRTGGDEFIILMPGATEQDGLRQMEDIRKLIDINNQYYATQQSLSLSMGMATCASSEWLDDMLRRADMAMYEEKREYHASAR